MPIETPGCCDTQYELIRKILLTLPSISTGGGGSGNVQSGTQAIVNGSDTVSVTFPVAFASIPDLVVSISRPAAESLIDVNIDQASITTTGFTASLGGAASSANYILNWMGNV